MTGLAIGILGLALTALMCGIGSGLGLRSTATATAGVLAEDPKKWGKVMLLTLLPATQGLYGFNRYYRRNNAIAYGCQYAKRSIGFGRNRFVRRNRGANYGARLEYILGLSSYDDRRYDFGYIAR